MKAYVLAAGYGTRLGAIASDVPKPLLEVSGRPVLSHLMDRVCEIEGLEEVVVVSNHRFVDRFEAWAAAYEGPDGVPLLRVLDDGTTKPEGRLGATRDLALALERAPSGDDPFLVTAADFVPLFDVSALARDFRAVGAPLLALRSAGPRDGPGGHCEVTLEGATRVTRFREKPVDGNHTGIAALCLYIFTAEVGTLLSSYLDGGGEADAPGHFVSWLVERTPVHGAFIGGDWLDVGDPEALERARARMGS